MNKESIFLEPQTDWQAVDKLADGDINTSDIPEVKDADLESVRPADNIFECKGIIFDSTEPVRTQVNNEDGSVTEHWLPPVESKKRIVTLDSDVAAVFNNSEKVNTVLRSIINALPQSN